MLNAKLNSHIKELAGEGKSPLAVAFSGGGDSTALLSLVMSAFKSSNRDVNALIVDHGLREGSDQEAKLAASRARKMGAIPKILKWQHDNPDTGIQEKARIARYGLMGEVCRDLGIGKLFLGHNRDDQAETIWMRQQKHSGWRGLAGMQARVIAPIWPQLRDVEIIRPLLGQSRQSLRDYNVRHQLKYIDDPSNENLRFERIRARHDLMEDEQRTADMIDLMRENQFDLRKELESTKEFISQYIFVEPWGGVRIGWQGLEECSSKLPACLRYILPAVSGQSGFPPSTKLESLGERLQKDTFKGATFAGTRLVRDEGSILIVRDPGMVLGRSGVSKIKPLKLRPHLEQVWDGRYLVKIAAEETHVASVGSQWDKLCEKTKAEFKTIPLSARKTIPCFLDPNGNVTIASFAPSDQNTSGYRVKSLISQRLCGFIGSKE